MQLHTIDQLAREIGTLARHPDDCDVPILFAWQVAAMKESRIGSFCVKGSQQPADLTAYIESDTV